MTRDTEQEVKPCKFVGGACVNCDATERGDCQGFVYNTHTSREWVGLTDEEIHRTTVLLGFNPEWKTEIGMAHAIVRNLEAKLKEKNDH